MARKVVSSTGEAERIRTAKRRMAHEKPTVWVGKSGVTASMVGEIDKQLEKKGFVKVKVLRSALEEEGVKDIARRIAGETESRLVDIRGHTFILYRPKKPL